MPWFLRGNCVWSGTKEEPGKEVKCHEDHAKAVAHMRALYSNVEDAKALEEAKGGRGSGWHKPPRMRPISPAAPAQIASTAPRAMSLPREASGASARNAAR
jgi:hypothetical protein